MAHVRHASTPSRSIPRKSFIGRLIPASALLATLALSAVASAATDVVGPPAAAAPVINESPKDRLEMHAPGDDHAAMPAGLGVAPEAGAAADHLATAKTTAQSTLGAPAVQDRTQVRFYADTDHPKNGTYTIGQQANICFTVRGMLAVDTLHMIIKDADGAVVSDQYAPVVPHSRYAHQCLPVPSSRLGFYRAGVHLMRTHLTLAALRSRPGGYLTYVVLPDPILRMQYPASETFFGLQMPDTITYLSPNLGVRWALGAGKLGLRLALRRASVSRAIPQPAYVGPEIPRRNRCGYLERRTVAAVRNPHPLHVADPKQAGQYLADHATADYREHGEFPYGRSYRGQSGRRHLVGELCPACDPGVRRLPSGFAL